MKTTFTANISGHRKTNDGKDTSDDISEATAPTTPNEQKTAFKIVKKTLKFRFDVSHIDDPTHAPPAAIHSEWMRTINETYGDDVRIIDNKNNRILDFDPIKWCNPIKHIQHFKIHKKKVPDRNHGQYGKKHIHYIIHHVQLKISFNELKHTHNAFKILKENHSFMTEHYWSPNEFEVIQLGFFQGYNPQYYERNDATKRVAKYMLSKGIKANKIPRFQLVQSVNRAQWEGQHSGTKAYSIEVMLEDASKMTDCLKVAYKDNPDQFVAYKMRRNHPESFYKAVRKQNYILSNQHTVVINHIGTAAMFYLEERIKAIAGVQDVVESRNCTETGKMNVLVNKELFKEVREHLTEKFKKWYEQHVPEESKPIEDQYKGPPEVQQQKGGSFGSGDGSWLTSSAESYKTFDFSFMTNDDDEITKQSGDASARSTKQDKSYDEYSYHESIPHYINKTIHTKVDPNITYAERTKENNSKSTASTKSISEVTASEFLKTQTSEELVRIVMELNKKLDAVKSESQEELERAKEESRQNREEIQQLSVMVKQLLIFQTLNQNTNPVVEPTSQKTSRPEEEDEDTNTRLQHSTSLAKRRDHKTTPQRKKKTTESEDTEMNEREVHSKSQGDEEQSFQRPSDHLSTPGYPEGISDNLRAQLLKQKSLKKGKDE
jgi:hypothetical protein